MSEPNPTKTRRCDALLFLGLALVALGASTFVKSGPGLFFFATLWGAYAMRAWTLWVGNRDNK